MKQPSKSGALLGWCVVPEDTVIQAGIVTAGATKLAPDWSMVAGPGGSLYLFDRANLVILNVEACCREVRL